MKPQVTRHSPASLGVTQRKLRCGGIETFIQRIENVRISIMPVILTIRCGLFRNFDATRGAGPVVAAGEAVGPQAGSYAGQKEAFVKVTVTLSPDIYQSAMTEVTGASWPRSEMHRSPQLSGKPWRLI